MADDLLDFISSLPSGSSPSQDADSKASESEGEHSQPEDGESFDEEYERTDFDNLYTGVLRALTIEAFQSLQTLGYVVIDNAFGPTHCAAFRQEIRWLHTHNLLNSNATAYVSNDQGKRAISQLITKPNVLEAELLPHVRSKLPRLSHLFQKGIPLFEDKFKRYLPELKIYHGDTSIKVQYNIGGCFPFHFDSPGDRKDSRRLTMLLYLNENWQLDHGGILRVQPFLKPAIDIPPRNDRIVLFYGHRLLHRVLPYYGPERAMLIMWFHGKSTDEEEITVNQLVNSEWRAAQSQAPTNTSPAGSEATEAAPSVNPTGSVEYWMQLLQRPGMQRLLCKPLYRDEWVASYQQAHRESAQPLVESIDRDVQLMMHQPGLGSVVDLLKDIVKSHSPTNVDGIEPLSYYDPSKPVALAPPKC